MQLFYHPELDNETNQFTFPVDESRHISKVLRKKSGDILHITNGKGIWYEAEILNPDHKKCTAKITANRAVSPNPYRLHMVVAPTKLNDRFEWFLEKATEIGVHEITPIICDHSERKVIKQERMEKVIQSAMKQSLQTYLPKLNRAISFKEFMTLPNSDNCFIAHCENNQKKELLHAARPKENTSIMIGPEGDFSENEIEMALQNNYKAVALGNNRLRTETAAIVACTTLAMINL
ncbi:16S rRNA (uracil(1498)-N(3))-methyltransferase [Arenibacter aquaticus]|uniref:Ribosomal RNA small subunit methyltransferase E n=1 Tax=Arenibacter aquaticus TaxID=2489054 RepID=A0A3S0BVR8_9FLAO|nr:16S rRNA (uracil(1498)-N(3))-methyltransferase [Arenibacter aquaticus]RTE52728.1 16S rRNA (uracil(1498)-N(3))-methyltransferase [Arenibacter aquaticus]